MPSTDHTSKNRNFGSPPQGNRGGTGPALIPGKPLQFESDDARWNVLVNRMPAPAEAFFYGVKTTGVYCRPGCSSRRPARPNVEFFNTSESALHAGYRPCKRCQPDKPSSSHPGNQTVQRACRTIEAAEEPPSLNQLAAEARLSPSRFHRLFKQKLGVTPKQYAGAIRGHRVRSHLMNTPSITDSLYASGFNSGSRFYEQAARILGMLPSTFAQGAPGELIHHTTVNCSLGQMLVAATRTGICALFLGDHAGPLEDDLRRRFPRATLQPAPARFKKWIQRVVAGFESRPTLPDLPLDIRGTAFRRKVWASLQQIPPGQTRTYAQIARGIGKPKAARAVGSAIGNNPISIAIPCHRVVRTDNTPGGYHWGLARKLKLLAKEKPQ